MSNNVISALGNALTANFQAVQTVAKATYEVTTDQVLPAVKNAAVATAEATANAVSQFVTWLRGDSDKIEEVPTIQPAPKEPIEEKKQS